jgi:hypothetical protein
MTPWNFEENAEVLEDSAVSVFRVGMEAAVKTKRHVSKDSNFHIKKAHYKYHAFHNLVFSRLLSKKTL